LPVKIDELVKIFSYASRIFSGPPYNRFEILKTRVVALNAVGCAAGAGNHHDPPFYDIFHCRQDGIFCVSEYLFVNRTENLSYDIRADTDRAIGTSPVFSRKEKAVSG